MRRAPMPTPTRGCAECGAPIRSWRTWVLCRHCVTKIRRRDRRDPQVTSLREYRRRRDGKCTVCGGPYPDGSGCEFCPQVVCPDPDHPMFRASSTKRRWP